jgi:beta-mannosidase
MALRPSTSRSQLVQRIRLVFYHTLILRLCYSNGVPLRMATLRLQVSASNAILRLSITATSSDSNSAGSSSSAESYTHISYLHPTALANSALLDPGPKLESGSGYGVYQTSFTVTATTAVAAWVWLDYQTSQVQGYFEQNGFWLLRGESRTVGFKHWNDWTENGGWIKGVTVSCMWNNTLA